MKKILCTCVFVVAALTVNAQHLGVCSAILCNSIESNLEQQSSSSWEKIGAVILYGSAFSLEGTLYVRKVGDRYFYKVVVGNKEYAVSFGKYTYDGKSYNAKAGGYYLNI